MPPPKPPSPADKNAHASTRIVYEYITQLMERPAGKLMSGQFLGWYPHLTQEAAETIHQNSGKWVAIIGLDYYETKLDDDRLTQPELHKPARWREVNPLAHGYWSKGGLTTLSLHMTNPQTGGKAWDISQMANASLLATDGVAGRTYREQLAQVADGIDDLQKKGIVVLFRPFHEWDGGWFWWGKLEPELARSLWRQLFHYFTNERHLHNIIWVYNGSMDRYPGDEFVDINSIDIYAPSPLAVSGKYHEMKITGKPFAIAEFGPPGGSGDPNTPRNYDYAPFAKTVDEIGPGIVYFLAWRDAWGLHRNPGTRELLNDPRVLNRNDLERELFPKLANATPGAAGPFSNGTKKPETNPLPPY